MVVYPSSGDIMRACRILPSKAILDSTLYYYVVSTADEAAYLISILNAPSLNNAFVQSRESGRHFHQHPWRKIPIRKYDTSNSNHKALAHLGVKAEKAVAAWLRDHGESSGQLSQVGLSSRLRDHLLNKGIFTEIDEVVKKILPDYAMRSKP